MRRSPRRAIRCRVVRSIESLSLAIVPASCLEKFQASLDPEWIEERLGSEPIRWLFERCADPRAPPPPPRGRRSLHLPKRRHRSYPRAVKMKMNNYPRKRRGLK